MDEGKQPFQGAEDLILLRNALVHFKPEWTDNPRASASLEQRLRGKFRSNPLSGGDELFIPYRACGSPAAFWAIKTVIAFVNEFYSRLAIDAKKVRKMLALRDQLGKSAA
jgi:hypothetical protein